MRNFTYIPPDENDECYMLVCVRTSFAPFIAGAVRRLEFRGVWDDEESWRAGEQAALEFQEALMNCKAMQHLEEVSVLLAHASGLTDKIRPEEIEQIMPALAARLKTIRDEGLDNLGLLNTEISRYLPAGSIPDGFLGLDQRKVEAKDLLEALRAGNQQTKTDLFDRIFQILNSTASGLTIVDIIKDFLGDTIDTGIDGGLLAVTILSTIGNIVAQTNMYAQLDRIIGSLDGGGLIQPTDNVLQALRGDRDTPASATRNLASLSEGLLERLKETDPAGDSVLKNVEDLLK